MAACALSSPAIRVPIASNTANIWDITLFDSEDTKLYVYKTYYSRPFTNTKSNPIDMYRQNNWYFQVQIRSMMHPIYNGDRVF